MMHRRDLLNLRRCIDEHKMPGVRLYPNCHGYTLGDPCFGQLLKLAAATGCLIQRAVAMEDTRTQHPIMQVADVDLRPLADLMQENVAARVQLLNYRPTQVQLETQKFICAHAGGEWERGSGRGGVSIHGGKSKHCRKPHCPLRA